MKRLFLMVSAISLVIVTGCTHKKVEVDTLKDSQLSCTEINTELEQIQALKEDIDEKTGFSGRNVGMGLLFWPGVIVNEYNASKAEDLANQRKAKLYTLHKNNNCSTTQVVEKSDEAQSIKKD